MTLCLGGCGEPINELRAHVFKYELHTATRVIAEGVCDGCLKLINLMTIDHEVSVQDGARLLAQHPKRILIDAAFRLGTPDDGLRELLDGAAR